MAKMADIFGSAKIQDLKRVLNGEKVPYRGKKKHGTQMSRREKEYLFNTLKSVDKWEVSQHALDRIKDKGINVTYDDIISTIHNAMIIEYHVARYGDNKDDVRVVLRGNAVVNRNSNVHFVYSLTRKKIITSWLNRVDDKHETLDWRAYDSNLKILG